MILSVLDFLVILVHQSHPFLPEGLSVLKVQGNLPHQSVQDCQPLQVNLESLLVQVYPVHQQDLALLFHL